MKLPAINGRKWNYVLLAFAVPVFFFVVLMIIGGYMPFGNYSLLYSDMYHQYFPFFKAFRNALRSGDSLLYSWNVGMGIDYLGLISYYLASPLNLVSVLLPESWVLPYFCLLVPIKLGLAAAFFAFFLKKLFGRNDLSIVIFGCFYAMCAWALGYQWNVMWLDPFALLPLVALGTVSLLRDKKFILYTVSLFFAVFSNYYVGFFVCIFVLLLFICYQICRCKSIVRLLQDLCRIALFSALAIGMTAILELPALAALGTTQSSVNIFPEGFSVNIIYGDAVTAARTAWSEYKLTKEAGGDSLGLWFKAIWASLPPIWDGMKQIAGNMAGGLEPTFKEGLPNLYCGVGSLILAFLFLTSGKVKLRDKLCSVGLLVFFMISFILRQLDYIWHGFHFTNMIPYRFSFLFSFVMVYMAYRAFLMRRQFKIWQILCAGVLSTAVILCSEEKSDPVFIAYNTVFLTLYLAVFLMEQIACNLPFTTDKRQLREFCKGRAFRRKLAVWAAVGVFSLELIMNMVNFGVRFPYTDIKNYPNGTYNTAAMVKLMEQDPELFYRAETTHTQTLNDGALNGYNGISTFTSSANVKVTEFMQNLGYGAKNTYNRYCFEESSPVANLFLNLKYMLERDGRVEANSYFDVVDHAGKVYLLKNNAYLPLGFLADSALGEIDFENYTNAFWFQNQLFAAATGMKSQYVWTITPATWLNISPNGTNVTSQSSTGYCYYQNGSKQTTVTYTYNIQKNGFLCLELNMSARNSFTVKKNGADLYSESISLPQTLAVSDVQRGDVITVTITCKANQTGSIDITAGILNDNFFRQGYEILAGSTWELTEFSNTFVEGTINCNRNGLMYTSIPQNGDNWKVYVDGQEVQPVLVGGVMIGVPLTQGNHTVTFRYENAAFQLGWKMSLGCLAVFLGICWFVYWRKGEKFPKRKKNNI